MDEFQNDIQSTYKYLPDIFKRFNEVNGKEIYNEMIIGPSHNEETDDNWIKQIDTKSILILHLAQDTKELASYLEDCKSYLLK